MPTHAATATAKNMLNCDTQQGVNNLPQCKQLLSAAHINCDKSNYKATHSISC